MTRSRRARDSTFRKSVTANALARSLRMRMHRWPTTSLLAAVAAMLLIAGCGGSASPSTQTAGAPADSWGRLSGTLAVYGGEASVHSCGCVMEAGTLRLTDHAGSSRQVRVGSSGRFDVRLPAGDYRVVGGVPTLHWPVGSCHLFSSASDGRVPTAVNYVRVSASQTTRARVGCMGQ
jgi:hypothetical protein